MPGGLTPEVGLAILGVLTFALIPLHINTISSGLPAHPLFVHVPVILVPVATIGALVLVARPALFAGHGLWLGLVTVVALGSLDLAAGAGSALRSDLGLGHGASGQVASLVSQHSHAANMLRILSVLFTAAFLTTMAMYRHEDGSTVGVGLADRALAMLRARPVAGTALRAVIAVLALASLFYVYRTGDLGAKAVWLGRLRVR
jgi:hypothetical protein